MPTHNKKYQFAMSSFARIYGHTVLHNHDIKQFCLEWSEWGVNAPLSGLDEVDQYFYFEYKNWRGK